MVHRCKESARRHDSYAEEGGCQNSGISSLALGIALNLILRWQQRNALYRLVENERSTILDYVKFSFDNCLRAIAPS